MRRVQQVFVSLILVAVFTYPIQAEDSWSLEQQEVLAAIDQLSAATAPGGGGADAYGLMLAEEYSRWTIGSDRLNQKPEWLEGMREWFDIGWRVTDRESQILEVRITGDFAFTRRIVKETYSGPNDEVSDSSAAIAEVWIRGTTGWLLSRVDIHPAEG